MFKLIHDIAIAIYNFIHDFADHILSYITALMALFLSLPLMKIGGALLLICRLIVDAPPAYLKLKELSKK
jgi:hypothetical protein